MKHTICRTAVILLLCATMLSGCSRQTNPSSDPSATEESVSATEKAGDDLSGQPSETLLPSNDSNLPSTKDIPIYTLSDDASETKAIVVTLPEDYEITPKVIVDLVVENIADSSYVITVNNVTINEDAVVVDFSKDTPPVSGTTPEAETAILNAIAQSLIDNVSDCNGVIFHSDGMAYESEQYSFEFDDVYLNR